MSSVTFSTTVGGDGSTVTDDDDATTGLRNGGWRTRFVPALAQEVAVAANAVASATAALSSKNAAAASASAALSSQNSASTSETNAANSATAAAASYDSFDDRYLGVKTSDPSVDNDGNALLVGALYWNSATSVFKVWSGSAWITNLTSNQFGTNVATFLQTPSSANLAAALTDETGTAGKVVFDTSPTLITPNLGTPSAGVVTNLTGTASININGTVGATTPNTGAFTTVDASSTATAARFIPSGSTVASNGMYLPAANSVGISTASTERMRIDSAGNVGIGGGVALNYIGVYLGKNITGNANSFGIYAGQTVDSASVTGTARYFHTSVSNTAGSNAGVYHYTAAQGTLSGAVTYQYGFNVDSTLTGATNNYGFFGGIAAGTGRYNLYMAGTADNYMAGRLGIGTVPTTGESFRVGYTADTTATVFGIRELTVVNQATTTDVYSVASQTSILAPAALTSLSRFYAAQGSFTGTLTNQYGFNTSNGLTGATNNYGFFGSIASGTGRYNLYMAGTADNYLAGSLGIGTNSPSASAILDAQSTTKGVRFPNMTTTQKSAIASPAAGLVVFDTTLSKLCVYTGAAWQTITST